MVWAAHMGPARSLRGCGPGENGALQSSEEYRHHYHFLWPGNAVSVSIITQLRFNSFSAKKCAYSYLLSIISTQTCPPQFMAAISISAGNGKVFSGIQLPVKAVVTLLKTYSKQWAEWCFVEHTHSLFTVCKCLLYHGKATLSKNTCEIIMLNTA